MGLGGLEPPTHGLGNRPTEDSPQTRSTGRSNEISSIRGMVAERSK